MKRKKKRKNPLSGPTKTVLVIGGGIVLGGLVLGLLGR